MTQTMKSPSKTYYENERFKVHALGMRMYQEGTEPKYYNYAVVNKESKCIELFAENLVSAMVHAKIWNDAIEELLSDEAPPEMADTTKETLN